MRALIKTCMSPKIGLTKIKDSQEPIQEDNLVEQKKNFNKKK